MTLTLTLNLGKIFPSCIISLELRVFWSSKVFGDIVDVTIESIPASGKNVEVRLHWQRDLFVYQVPIRNQKTTGTSLERNELAG